MRFGDMSFQKNFLPYLFDGTVSSIIFAAEVGYLSSNIPDFEGVDKTAKQVLQGILVNTQSIEINKKCLCEMCFHDYIICRIRNESFFSGDPNEIRHDYSNSPIGVNILR